LLLIFLALISAVLFGAGKSLGNLVLRLCSEPKYRMQLEEFLYDCCDNVGELLSVEASGLQIFVTDRLNVFMDQAQQVLLPGAVGGSWEFLKGAGSWLAAVVVTGISILLLAADFEKIQSIAGQWLFYEKTVNTVNGILRSAGGYLKAQAVIMGIVMLICIAGVWISGSAGNPILSGIGTGLLDALPIFGTGTVFVPWILILVIQKKYISALILAVTYVISILARELLEPRLVGSRLGILPIVIFMSVYVGVKLYGFGGILLGPFSVLLVKELWRHQAVSLDK